ncbi:NAD(P)H-dependent oxidoreductase [Gilvimarinus sp. SDUM040013]|uniref:NAD(P)H-dependent oxidoreductase n=1 Tax=Gilvimarinus gilvus TaxID=3058038 RepID=A0ABU4RZE0_9GAMM|nr:NAD(P)H-dependent oxidoreductase [Gilvimarinus sp. SDUM040013]MDO3384673.1 NAD(P)H-dependent oxidoreductase [Gilvimarinus sp. SDUM040013]MDX6850259.1 NAD(P)H-dependent oxidoreductase [Gilvimarinus sp. SDUM040013]
MLKVLALSGSLRRQSYNTCALEAIRELAAANVSITLGDVGSLPLFNPDLEDSGIASVDILKAQLAEASGLIIASPEYAHGISGPMKNALDWLVSGVEFPGMPIMLINTSPRATHAQASLREVLTTMSGSIVEEASVAIPLLGSELDSNGILRDKQPKELLQRGLNSFVESMKASSRIPT